MFDVKLEKRKFKLKGWSYRRAAPKLGVCYTYLCDVLNGRRSSRRLLEKVRALEVCKQTTKKEAA